MATAATQPDVTRTDNKESSDFYRGEFYRVRGYRVAVCRDRLQWLFQRRTRPGVRAEARWVTIGYCRTRKALARLQQAHIGFVPPELADLPERFSLIEGDARNHGLSGKREDGK